MFMPANHSSPIVHYWAGRYPSKVGWLIGPTGMPKTKLRPWMPFALDNDAYSAWSKQRIWNEAAWFAMLEQVAKAGHDPLWVLVPDVVADRTATLAKWHHYAPLLKQAFPQWRLAIAVQDGMTDVDVPPEADVVFVGGTREWKWHTVTWWAALFPHVHVGRVNEMEKLLLCEHIGVTSIDGTGWFRDERRSRFTDLCQWMETHSEENDNDYSRALARREAAVDDSDTTPPLQPPQG